MAALTTTPATQVRPRSRRLTSTAILAITRLPARCITYWRIAALEARRAQYLTLADSLLTTPGSQAARLFGQAVVAAATLQEQIDALRRSA